MSAIYIIGCGGVGSWLAPSLALLAGKENLVLMDGDKLEPRNLNRQLFKPEQVGQSKAEALGELYGCEYRDQWYQPGLIDHAPGDWLMCCVDNNLARAAVLAACDRCRCGAIFAANETTSAEAYYYVPVWKGTRLDPRVMYPEILTDKTNDPQARAIGCTGEVQQNNRQLVSANYMAAALAQHLFVLWAVEVPKMATVPVSALPHKLVANLSNLETHLIGTDKL